jgi:hypothetical protein
MATRDFGRDYSTDNLGMLSVEQITSETVREFIDRIPELDHLSTRRQWEIIEQLTKFVLGFYEQGIERGENNQ